LTLQVKRSILYLVKSRISSKGQVTVPVEIRDQLGLAAGTEIEFVLRDGEAVLRKGGGPTHPVDRVYGRLRLEEPVDALLDAMRGPRPIVGPNRRRRRRS
jgi:AbrB family looped-hinge helix DNA binding protein